MKTRIGTKGPIRKRAEHFLGGILTPLHHAPFWLGKCNVGSIEGFLHGMKKEDNTRERSALMVKHGVEARKHRGEEIPRPWYLFGSQLIYWHSAEHIHLVKTMLHTKLTKYRDAAFRLVDSEGMFSFDPDSIPVDLISVADYSRAVHETRDRLRAEFAEVGLRKS